MECFWLLLSILDVGPGQYLGLKSCTNVNIDAHRVATGKAFLSLVPSRVVHKEATPTLTIDHCCYYVQCITLFIYFLCFFFFFLQKRETRSFVVWNFAKLNMRAVYAVRSSFTNLCFLQFNPHLSQKVSSGTFNGVINLHSSSWPLLRITKTARKVDSLFLINHSTAYYTIKPTRSFRDNIQLNKRITSLKTVDDHLELFNSFKNSANIVNRVTMLHCIAKIAERDKKQKQMLKMGQRRENSPYLALLESITGVIYKCQPRQLANLMWALGQTREKEHKLVKVCEKEILSRGIVTFHNAGISQIVNGCANLNLKTSRIFGSLQEAILNGQLTIEDFEDRQLWGILLSFCKMSAGSAGMFDVVLKEILSRDISNCQPRDLANLMWALGQIGEKEHKLVKLCEKEILSRGIVAFHNAGISQIVNGCANLNLKTSRIFGSVQEAILNGQLTIEDFEDRQLWGILLSFCKMSNGSAGMFDVVLKEILSRDISKCQPRQLANLMWALGQIGEKEHKLVKLCEKEILSRGIVAFHNAGISQIVNGCANLNLKTSRIFGSLQEAILNGQLTIEDFEDRQLWGILLSFCKISAGSAGMFDVVLKEILSRDISKCQPRDLANLMWVLGQIREKEQKLVGICEKQILSRDIMAFNNAHICQIIKGCANLNLRTSKIFESLQEAILNGQLKIEDFEDLRLRTVLLSFCKIENVSGICQVVLKEILSRGISKFQPRELANLMWALGQIKEKEHKLVVICEKEILSRGIMAFDNAGICQIVSGCVDLNLRTSRIFGELHKAILNGQLKIEDVGPS